MTTILPWTWRPARIVTASRIRSTGKTAPASTPPAGRTPPGGLRLAREIAYERWSDPANVDDFSELARRALGELQAASALC